VGIGTGLGAACLALLLQSVQHAVWPGSSPGLLAATQHAEAWRHLTALLGAGLLVGLGQFVLVRLASGNSIDVTTAIWFDAGRLPAVRTVASAILSVT
jgi:hypothetical protein